MRSSNKLVRLSLTPSIAAIVAIMSGVIVQTARADLLAYEGFNYTEGTGIAGQTGGFGWAAGWATGSGNIYGTNVAGSLGYTDINSKMLATEGGSLLVSSVSISSAATPNRTLATFMSGPNTYSTLSNGTYWISFLAQRVGPSNSVPPYYSRQANLGLFQTSSERLDVGRPNTNSFTGTPYDTWSLWHANGTANNGTAFAQPSAYPLNSPDGASFLLLKVVTDGITAGNDTAYLWVNWTDLMSEPDISTATLTNTGFVNLDGVNNLRLQANGFSGALTNAFLLVDEIRVGTAFLDVAVPEPSVLALLGLGALVFIQRLRRK